MGKFNLGDCVRLKSGSAKMTIREYTVERKQVASGDEPDIYPVAICDWQVLVNGNYEKRTATYTDEQLELDE